MNFNKRNLWFSVLSLWFLSSCNSNRLDVDVSKINVPPVKIQRFEKDFFSLNAEKISSQLSELRKKYPGFTDLFVKNILCPNGIEDSACIPEITRFVNDKDMRAAYENCQKVFPDLNSVETELSEVARHSKYYFPKKRFPTIFSMMSGFNYSIARVDTSFAIGLEKYLGRKNDFYEMLQIPDYKRVTMSREYIAPDIIRAWMMKEFPDNVKSKTLLSEMIYQGKLLYLTDALMPSADDTLKIGFTKKQMDWCSEHAKDIWSFWIKNKLLLSNETEAIIKFTGEGPFTTGFVKESPARTGVWTGRQIVRKYMDNNPKISLEELMKENDPQKILSFSKYKP